MELAEHQLHALDKMHDGCILCGTVGSGKSRTALAYYILKVCKGSFPINGHGSYRPMVTPKDLIIITTAKKRDDKEWEKELYEFVVPDVTITVDSWQNITKYKGEYGKFFIFDEQRLVSFRTWAKTFIRICNRNEWILLSATPGDKWTDYLSVFIANKFYKNKTDFIRQHIIYDPFVTKYPKIIGYNDEGLLEKHIDDILVLMKDNRHTERHIENVKVSYNKEQYREVNKTRWDPFENKPIQEVSKYCHVLRHIVNIDKSRMEKTLDIIIEHKRVIIFYNYNYELDALRNLMYANQFKFGEWNGNKHESIPSGKYWVYLVQYTAGCEGWNCIECDTILFYSLNYSYKTMVQAMGRIDRMNTPFTDLYYYRLVSTAPIDHAIEIAIQNGKKFNENAWVRKLHTDLKTT